MYELHFAAPMSGAILNTINTRLDARTISVLLQHSETKLVFVDYLSSSLILEAITLFPANCQLPLLVLIKDENENENYPFSSFYGTYESLVERGDPKFEWVRPNCELDPLTLNYTSGTTSSPKGVLNSHRGAFLMAVDSLLQWSVPKQPVYLWTLPMFHANGWSYTWGTAAVGGTNICLRRVDAESIYSAINKHGVTHMCGAPVVLNMLANCPGNEPIRNPVWIMTAGAPPPAAVLARAESLGFVISHGYGLTETAGLVVTCAWKQEWDKLPVAERAKLKSRQGIGSIGTTEVDVLRPESGLSVPRDGSTLGDVVLKCGSLMLGYLKDPDGTAECMTKNGWFYTGDVGVMHPDGYLEIKDRSKDVIISGGENLSSVEVESVLYSHPSVHEAAVAAQPDNFWGEIPCAFVSLKADTTEKTSEKEIREFCKSKLPKYMVPRKVFFKDESPKTSTGKIQKYLLREMAKAMKLIDGTPEQKIVV